MSRRSPRRLKQFISVFRLKAYIANQLALFDDDEHGKQKLTFEQLGKFVAISLTWTQLIGDLASNPILLATLEEDAVAKAEAATGKPNTTPVTQASKPDSIWAHLPQLSGLLQYGCVEKPGWPLDRPRYSLRSVDFVPMLEISPQVVRATRKIPEPAVPATATEMPQTAQVQARPHPRYTI